MIGQLPLWTDLFFPQRGGGREGIAKGYKGIGTTLHALTDGEGNLLSFTLTPANDSELMQVEPLLKQCKKAIGRTPRLLFADRGYDAEWLRYKLTWFYKMGSSIPMRKFDASRKGQYRPIKSDGVRWKVERTFAWLYKKFRRLTQRWERLFSVNHAFFSLGFCKLWMDRLLR